MGLQNSTVRHIGVSPVHTTYVSGLLTSLTVEIVGHFFRNHDQRRSPITPSSVDQLTLSRIALMSGIYAAYVAGAVLGGFAEIMWALASLLVPVCFLCIVIIFDLLHARLETTA